jgi:hypothetical protein
MHASKSPALVLAAALFAGGISVAAAGAAAESQCQSNHNLSAVDRRLAGVIANLNHDQSDYGGHKATAITALENARGQIREAAHIAIRNDNENPACFRTWNGTGAPDFAGDRGQYGSDRNIAGDVHWIGSLLAQLGNDDRDYAGHKAAAMRQMEVAQNELRAADHFARTHGE